MYWSQGKQQISQNILSHVVLIEGSGIKSGPNPEVVV